MTVELRPMGVACNLGCTYCYQEPMRKAGNINTRYDVDKMLKEAEATGQEFSLFGGEALLIPKKDLERFWSRGYELHGSNGMQTNGTLIDDDHIALFKKYNVHVGISIDGPNELNSLRPVRGKVKNEQATLDATQTIVDNIMKLSREGISVSIIITLHQQNGSEERLPRLLSFIRWLGDMGVRWGNIHTLEVDETMPDQEKHVLKPTENAKAFLKIAKFLEENPDLHYSPFKDMKEVMYNSDESTNCTWNFCDHMNTQAVYGIEGNGGLSNCGRTNKEGIDFYKADDTYYERYISLYNSPQDLGGCQGCRFFIACSGSCPGESADYDFRNKTIHCQTQKTMLGYYEKKALKEGIIPFSKRKDLKDVEEAVINSLRDGNPMRVMHALTEVDRHKKMRRVVEVR
jgi:uncharacterized protein